MLQKRIRRAITLTELPEVIVITKILIGILMLALRKVKERVKEIICRANLRQNGLAQSTPSLWINMPKKFVLLLAMTRDTQKIWNSESYSTNESVIYPFLSLSRLAITNYFSEF
jgi:hypothetical protein